jgi:hypothetical protein
MKNIMKAFDEQSRLIPRHLPMGGQPYPESPVMDNAPDSPHRGTGRTTKQLQEAMVIADRGTTVLYICPTFKEAVAWMGRRIGENISFAFRHTDAGMRNLCRGRYGIVIVDHACPDSFREIAKEFMR